MKENEKMEEILNAALSLFSSKGYTRTSMMDIANAVGLTKGGIYHYISKKEDTLIMIHNRMSNAFVTEFRKAAQSSDDPQHKLESWLSVHAHLVKDYKPHIKIFFTGLDHLKSSPHYARIVSMRDEIFDMLFGIIEDGRKQKIFRDDIHPRILTFLIMGMMNWFYQWYQPGGPRTIEKIIEDAQKLVIGGVVRH